MNLLLDRREERLGPHRVDPPTCRRPAWSILS